MLTTLKNNKSLTYYQQTSIPKSGITSAYAGGISSVAIAQTSMITTNTTTGFNTQLNSYINNSNMIRKMLVDQTSEYMLNVQGKALNPTASMLRDKNTWGAVKTQVVREELMKLQISGKTDLPLTSDEIQQLKVLIKDKDLTVEVVDKITSTTAKGSDKELISIFNKIVESKAQSAQDFMNAFKLMKESGQSSDCLQIAKLDELKDRLKDIDLSKITDKQFKELVENFCEVNEFHHRESISSDPAKQSMPDNIDVLKTSKHDSKHTDPNTGKINYKKPTNEELVNRQQDMKDGNLKRVLKNELTGLGIAVAIGVGIGATIGFIVTLAQSGVTPDTIKLAAIEGSKSGVEAGALSAVGYGIGKTIGEVASKAIAETIGNLGISITENIFKMINMGVVGALTITVFSTYQFIKLKMKGVATKEALMQVGKQALFSLSLLAVSIAAQGIWGGPAGIIVSVSTGIILISYAVGKSVHNRRFTEIIRVYMIDKCYPSFAI